MKGWIAAIAAAMVVAGALGWLVSGILVWGVGLYGSPAWWWQVFIGWFFAGAVVAAAAAAMIGLGKGESRPRKSRLRKGPVR